MTTPLLRHAVAAWLFLSALLFTSCRTADVATATIPGITRIALVSDVHVTHGTNEAARLHPIRLAKVIDDVQAANVDLVLVAGDLTEKGSSSELREFRRKMAKLKRPVWYVPGNHDLGNKRMPGTNGGKGEITFQRLRSFETEMGRSWWVREGVGVRVLGLNSGLYGSGFGAEEAMWKMMERELATTNLLPTLLLQHHPPCLKTITEPGGNYFNMEPYPRARLLALAKQGGVKAILSGHTHRSITNLYEGMLLYTTPPVAFGLPKDKQREGWTLVTVTNGKVEWQFRPIPKVE